MIIEFEDRDINEIVDRLKSASQIISEYEEETKKYCYYDTEQITLWNIINKLQTANNEIKLGIWRRMYNPYDELEGFIHEECGFSNTCAFNYCPSCGVKMDVEPARKNEKVTNYEIIKKNVF